MLITGAAGFLGNALFEKIKSYGLDKAFDGSDQYKIKADIRDREYLDHVFRNYQFDKVIHCAANKYVIESEKDPLLAIDHNINGTINIVDMCKKYNKDLISISTDKVVSPETVYGCTKYLCERYVLKYEKSVVIRLGNLEYSTDSVFKLWERNPEIIVNRFNGQDFHRYFISLDNAVNFILRDNFHYGCVYVPKMKIKNMNDVAMEYKNRSGKNVVYRNVKFEKLVEDIFNQQEWSCVINHDDYYECQYYENNL
jgi:UDP-glucose 4-epimerase